MRETERQNIETPHLLAILGSLVSEQKKELGGTNFPKCFDSWGTIYRWYLNTDRFKKAYKEAAGFYLSPHSPQDSKDNLDNFSGKIFEDIAYFILAKKQLDEDRIVLSPEKTFKFWENLYPDRRKKEFPYGGRALKGISVPDGLILEGIAGRGTILTKCEYTSSEMVKIEKKTNGHEKDKLNYPDIFNDTSVLYVAPEGILKDREVLRLPFSNLQLGTFINYIFLNYPENDELASLSDIQNRVREQELKGKTRKLRINEPWDTQRLLGV